MERSEQINELAAALAKAQSQIEPAPKDSMNPAFKSHYANLATTWEACRGPLTANGLAVVQTPEPDGQGGMLLRTTLLHTSGQTISGALQLAYDPTKMQSLGSAITYARRYALAAMVGIVAEEDDDGNAAVDTRERREPQREQPRAEPRRSDWGTAHRGEDRPRQPDRQHGAPTKGSHLFAWCMKQKEETGVDVAKWVQNWGAINEFPKKMVDYSAEQVSQAFAEANRKLQSTESQETSYEEALAN